MAILATILQLALALLTSVQGNSAAITDAQRQQAISVAMQAIQLAEQTLPQTGNGIPSTNPPISIGTTSTSETIQIASVCDLQNNPTAYLAKQLSIKATVSFSGINYYLEDQNCKIQVSSWAPIEVAQCPPEVSNCPSPSIMSDYVGKYITLNGQLNQQADNTGTYYLFQGNPISTSNPPISGATPKNPPIFTGTAVTSMASTTLSISLDSATPPGRMITPAMGSAEVVRYDFAASGGDVTVSDILMTANSVNCDFMNLQLIDPSTGAQIGVTVPLMTLGGGSCHAEFKNLNIVIPRNATRMIALKLAVPVGWPQETFSFNIGYLGASYGTITNWSPANTVSNVMTAPGSLSNTSSSAPDVLVASLSAMNPPGMQLSWYGVGSTPSVVLIFNLANTSSQVVNINSITLACHSNCLGTTPYYAPIASGEGILVGGTLIPLGSYSMSNNGDSVSYSNIKNVSIPANSTQTFAVSIQTGNSMLAKEAGLNNPSFSLELQGVTASDANGSATVQGMPVAGNTFTVN